MTPKDKKIIEDSERDNIPIFVLTAKDRCSTITILDYFRNCAGGGALTEHLKGIENRVEEFKEWQIGHPEMTHIPD